MAGENNRPEASGRRWWEIWGDREPDEERYGDLVTGGRGRSRPERSLSVGADLADEARHPLRALLWPAVSVVAVVVLIVVVMNVVPKLRSPAGTDSAVASNTPLAVQGQAFVPPVPLGGLPPIGGSGGFGSGGAPGGLSGGFPGGGPGDLGVGPGGNPGGPSPGIPGEAPGSLTNNPGTPSNPPSGTSSPGPTTPVQIPEVTLDGPAPSDAPGPQGDNAPVSGGGGCTAIPATTEYACAIPQNAPAYLPGTTDPRGPLTPRQYAFLCQSDGSRYSAGTRTNHWWAWVGIVGQGAWVPVVFLAGGPDNAPEPGLPVCRTATTTAAPTTTAPPRTPTPTPTTTATATTAAPTSKSTAASTTSGSGSAG